MRSIKLHILVTQDISRQFLLLERSIFGQERRRKLLSIFLVHEMSTCEGLASTPSRVIAAFASSIMEMGSCFHGFYYRIANDLETT